MSHFVLNWLWRQGENFLAWLRKTVLFSSIIHLDFCVGFFTFMQSVRGFSNKWTLSLKCDYGMSAKYTSPDRKPNLENRVSLSRLRSGNPLISPLSHNFSGLIHGPDWNFFFFNNPVSQFFYILLIKVCIVFNSYFFPISKVNN